MKRIALLIAVGVLAATIYAAGPPDSKVGFSRVSGNDSTFYLNNAYAVYLVDPTSGDSLRALILEGSLYIAYADTSDDRLKKLIGDSTTTNADSVQNKNVTGTAAGTGEVMIYNAAQDSWSIDSLGVGYFRKGSAISGQYLYFNGTAWAPATLVVDSSKITNYSIALNDIEQKGATDGQPLEWSTALGRWAPGTDATGGGTGDSALYLARTAGGSNLVKWQNYGVWFYYDVGSFTDSAGFYLDTTTTPPSFVIDAPGDTTKMPFAKIDTLYMAGSKVYDIDGNHLKVASGQLYVDLEGIGLNANGLYVYNTASFNLTDSNTAISTSKLALTPPVTRDIMKWVDTTAASRQAGTDNIYADWVMQTGASLDMNNLPLLNSQDPADATGIGDRGYNDNRYLELDGTGTMAGDLNMANYNLDAVDTIDVAIILPDSLMLGSGRYIKDVENSNALISSFGGFGLTLATDPGPPYAAELAVDQAMNPSWTGSHNFGGATGLEIPNGADPTTNAEGELAWDSDDDMFEIYNGSVSIAVPVKKSMTIPIPDPENYEGDFPIYRFRSSVYPHGVTITGISLSSPASISYALTVEEWDDEAGSTQGTVEALALSSGTMADSTDIADAAIAAGAWLNLIIPATDVDRISVEVEFYANPGN